MWHSDLQRGFGAFATLTGGDRQQITEEKVNNAATAVGGGLTRFECA